jgi:hypothetical protein
LSSAAWRSASEMNGTPPSDWPLPGVSMAHLGGPAGLLPSG